MNGTNGTEGKLTRILYNRTKKRQRNEMDNWKKDKTKEGLMRTQLREKSWRWRDEKGMERRGDASPCKCRKPRSSSDSRGECPFSPSPALPLLSLLFLYQSPPSPLSLSLLFHPPYFYLSPLRSFFFSLLPPLPLLPFFLSLPTLLSLPSSPNPYSLIIYTR